MFWLFLTLGIILFTFIAWRNLPTALAIFFTLLPTYLIRFHIGPLPTTVLEMMFGVIFVVWVMRHCEEEGSATDEAIPTGLLRRFRRLKLLAMTGKPSKHSKLLILSITLFLIGSTISVFTAVDLHAALGEWRAFYVEPIIMFLILITTIKTKKEINQILLGLVLCGLVTSILAVYQHFTGWLVPYSFWANRNTYRVTGWYGFPNAVGIFLAMIIPLAFYLIKEKYRWLPILYIITALLGIIFAKSTGPLIGLAAGLGVYLLLNKKTRLPALAIGVIGLIGFVLIPTNNPIKKEVLAQDYSGQLRRDIWSETITYLKIHSIRGAGLASYEEEIMPFRHNKKIEVFHHPHNIFLTMWVNTGIVGLIGFFGILGWFFTTRVKGSLKITLIITMVVWLVIGLVDSPYIKNDWAMMFWLLPALVIINQKYASPR